MQLIRSFFYKWGRIGSEIVSEFTVTLRCLRNEGIFKALKTIIFMVQQFINRFLTSIVLFMIYNGLSPSFA